MTNQNSWQFKIYKNIAGRSALVKNSFGIAYAILILFLTIGVWRYVSKNQIDQLFYTTAVSFGRVALVLLGVVVLPGILGRFGIEIPITRIITAYRRQFGILVFLFAFSHATLVRTLPKLLGIIPTIPLVVFETFGVLALTILFFMFFTSNNLSVKTLGKNWKRLHRFIYLALWLLVLHTGLQRISIWSVFIFAFATLEIASLIYYYLKKKQGKA